MPEQNKWFAKASSAAAKIELLQFAGAKPCHLHRGLPCAAAVWGPANTGIADGKLHLLQVHALRSESRLAPGAALVSKMRIMLRAMLNHAKHCAVVAKAWDGAVDDGLVNEGTLTTMRGEDLALLRKGSP